LLCLLISLLSYRRARAHTHAHTHTHARTRTRTHSHARRTRARPPHRVLHLAQDVDLCDHHPPLLGVHPPVAELLPNQHLPDANQPTRARASGHANGIGKGTCAHVRVNGRTHRNASAPTRASIGIRMRCVRAIVQAEIGRIQFTGVCMYQCRREIPGGLGILGALKALCRNSDHAAAASQLLLGCRSRSAALCF
jgi:hypothetical protein